MSKWVKLIKSDFMYGVSEPWCNDKGVAILPFCYQYNQYWFLLIHEQNPLLKNKIHQNYGTLTGGCESKIDLITTVKKELYEETGIDTKDNNSIEFYDLGSYYANKTNIKIWYLFAVDLTTLNLDLEEIYYGQGDGTTGEKNINGIFVNELNLANVNDTLALAIYGKLKLDKILTSSPIIQ